MTTNTTIPNAFEAGLPAVDYGDGLDIARFHREVRNARQHAPIAIGQYGPELLSYDLVRSMFRDSRFVMPQGIGLVIQDITSGPVWDRVCKLLVSMDGAEHHRLRRLVSRAFTPRAADRMRAACVDVINELVDAVSDRRSCDMVADISNHYPIPIICALLGAPRADWKLFSDWASDVSRAFGVNVAEEEAAILRSWQALDNYVEDLIARRRQSLGDDLISELIRVETDGDRLTHDELLNLVMMLLNAGTDTTRNQLAAAVELFCDHPDQWAMLAARPELARNAVEEATRLSPIVFSSLRKAAEDVELCGVLIPAGTFVIGNTAAANRDPAVYDEPERMDITRSDRPAVLTLGGGVHYCLGAHLARVELAEALAVLARRMPNLRRTGPAPWKPLTELSGPITLPIAWE